MMYPIPHQGTFAPRINFYTSTLQLEGEKTALVKKADVSKG